MKTATLTIDDPDTGKRYRLKVSSFTLSREPMEVPPGHAQRIVPFPYTQLTAIIEGPVTVLAMPKKRRKARA